jgi:hypothetical protein
MQNYIVIFILLTFYSAVVIGGLQEVLNVAKFIADIHKQIPNSCVFIMKSEREDQGKNIFIYFPCTNGVIFKKNVFRFWVNKIFKTNVMYIFINNRLWIICGNVNSLDLY